MGKRKKKNRLKRKECRAWTEMILQAQRDLGVVRYRIQWWLTKKPKKRSPRRWQTFATISVNLEGLRAGIQFYPKALEDWHDNREDFILGVYHEVAHLLTEPLLRAALRCAPKQERRYLETIGEILTEEIARAGYFAKTLREKLDGQAD